MGEIAVKLTNISKKYTLYKRKPTLVENIFSIKRPEKFWALRGVNLTIHKGEKVGIIGPNGAGKTTLFNIITGITTPSSGFLYVKGKIVSLIELEAGFHPDLTGEENIYLNGLIMGMTKDEIASNMGRIISFADIGEFINSPMYTYSKGMKLRLGFSVAVHASPDLLALDENISVGDEDFREKSLKKIQEFFKLKKTIIISSHYLNYVQKSCDRTIWLNKGKIIMDGESTNVIREYEHSSY